MCKTSVCRGSHSDESGTSPRMALRTYPAATDGLARVTAANDIEISSKPLRVFGSCLCFAERLCPATVTTK